MIHLLIIILILLATVPFWLLVSNYCAYGYRIFNRPAISYPCAGPALGKTRKQKIVRTFRLSF